ncbi:MAG: hypothetical protein ACREJC_01020 [Tepidisphaeraceae bacterium]
MRRFYAVVASVIILACSGCGDTQESLAVEGVATMKEMVSVLGGVKDEATAKSAKPKLKVLAERINDINERASKLPPPTEAEIKTMESKYGREMEEVQLKFASEMLRCMTDPKITAELDDIGQSMKPPRR